MTWGPGSSVSTAKCMLLVVEGMNDICEVSVVCTDADHSKDTINLLASLLSPGVHL